MKKPTKKAREMTTEELAKRLFPRPMLKKNEGDCQSTEEKYESPIVMIGILSGTIYSCQVYKHETFNTISISHSQNGVRFDLDMGGDPMPIRLQTCHQL